jgi:hypothetical protein
VNQLRAISAIARADFLERVRRYSFLLTLLFAVFLGYAAATGRIAVQLGEYRGIYTSAWIGALIAHVFYLSGWFLYREERHRPRSPNRRRPDSGGYSAFESRVHAGQIP